MNIEYFINQIIEEVDFGIINLTSTEIAKNPNLDK